MCMCCVSKHSIDLGLLSWLGLIMLWFVFPAGTVVGKSIQGFTLVQASPLTSREMLFSMKNPVLSGWNPSTGCLTHYETGLCRWCSLDVLAVIMLRTANNEAFALLQQPFWLSSMWGGCWNKSVELPVGHKINLRGCEKKIFQCK